MVTWALLCGSTAPPSSPARLYVAVGAVVGAGTVAHFHDLTTSPHGHGAHHRGAPGSPPSSQVRPRVQASRCIAGHDLSTLPSVVGRVALAVVPPATAHHQAYLSPNLRKY